MNQRQRIRYALRAGGDLTTPDQEAARPSAARSNYSCLVCQEALTLKAASSTKVTPYFSHAPGSHNSEGHAPESVIHLAAKARLMAALGTGKPLVALHPCTELSCPGLVTLPLDLPEHDEIRAEVGLEDTTYRLDVAMRRVGRAVFAFEARHTHAVGEAKARHLDRSVPWIEFVAEDFAAQEQLRVLDGNLWGGNPHACLCPACAALKPSERMWAREALEARLWLRSFPREAELIAQLYVCRLEKGFAALGGVKAKNARAAWFKELAQADETIFEIAFLEHWGEALTPQRCGEGQACSPRSWPWIRLWQLREAGAGPATQGASNAGPVVGRPPAGAYRREIELPQHASSTSLPSSCGNTDRVLGRDLNPARGVDVPG